MTVILYHLSLYHFISHFPSSPSCIPNATHSIISALLCPFRYSVAASHVHPDNQCITVSFVCLHILHLSLSRGKPLFAFHALVSTICSCTAIIDATFFGSTLHCSHLWLSSSSYPYTSLCICLSLYFYSLQFSDFPFIKGYVRYIFARLCLSLNESSCQTKKNVFHFTSKALFVLEKIKF